MSLKNKILTEAAHEAQNFFQENSKMATATVGGVLLSFVLGPLFLYASEATVGLHYLGLILGSKSLKDTTKGRGGSLFNKCNFIYAGISAALIGHSLISSAGHVINACAESEKQRDNVQSMLMLDGLHTIGSSTGALAYKKSGTALTPDIFSWGETAEKYTVSIGPGKSEGLLQMIVENGKGKTIRKQDLANPRTPTPPGKENTLDWTP